jgi:hypothetical protein
MENQDQMPYGFADYVEQLEAYCQSVYCVSALEVVGDELVVLAAFKHGLGHEDLANHYGDRYGLIKLEEFGIKVPDMEEDREGL